MRAQGRKHARLLSAASPLRRGDFPVADAHTHALYIPLMTNTALAAFTSHPAPRTPTAAAAILLPLSAVLLALVDHPWKFIPGYVSKRHFRVLASLLSRCLLPCSLACSCLPLSCPCLTRPPFPLSASLATQPPPAYAPARAEGGKASAEDHGDAVRIRGRSRVRLRGHTRARLGSARPARPPARPCA